MINHYSKEESEKILNETFPGIAIFARDINLDSSLASKYKKGMILREKAFVDATSRVGGMITTYRYLILSNRFTNIPSFEQEIDYGLSVGENNSYFKILDIQNHNEKTQIVLLHLPKDNWKFFLQANINIEDDLSKQVFEIFKNRYANKPESSFTAASWINRCSFPLGMTDKGVFFPLEDEKKKDEFKVEEKTNFEIGIGFLYGEGRSPIDEKKAQYQLNNILNQDMFCLFYSYLHKSTVQFYQRNFREFLPRFKSLASLGDVEAMIILSSYYFYGLGTGEVNYNEALSWLSLAFARERGFHSSFKLGLFWEKIFDASDANYPIALKRAIEYYKMASQYNYTIVDNHLSDCLYKLKYIPFYSHQLEELAESRLNKMACFYWAKILFEQKNAKASLKFIKDIELGNNVQQYDLLINIYKELKDDDKILEIVQQYAALGVIEAQIELGLYHFKSKNWKESIDIFSPISKKRNKIAQYMMHFFYEQGLGVEKDEKEAKGFLIRSAINSNADAIEKIMNSDELIDSMIKELTKRHYIKDIFLWLEYSAENGNVKHMYNLALFYLNIKQDKGNYLYWIDKASENGHKEAQKISNSGKQKDKVESIYQLNQAKEIANQVWSIQEDDFGELIIVRTRLIVLDLKDWKKQVVAYLYYFVDNYPLALEKLKEIKINEECLKALEILKRLEEDTLDAYFLKIISNDLAYKVKVAELKAKSEAQLMKLHPLEHKKLQKHYLELLDFLRKTKKSFMFSRLIQ